MPQYYSALMIVPIPSAGFIHGVPAIKNKMFLKSENSTIVEIDD